MKKHIILFALLLTGIVSCDQFGELEEVEKIENISATVQLSTASVDARIPRPDSYEVKFINYNDNLVFVKTADASGKVSVNDIVPGIYTVTATGSVLEQGFTYYFSGSLANINIVDTGSNLSIDLAASKSGALILKEIYYCGSKTPSGGSYFRDQFYEIYNNSESTVYVDHLCFGTLLPMTATALVYHWKVENPENYVYYDKIWQIPGSGTDYPLQPGESIIIAQMAANHRIAKLNPACPVNLISAEFETFLTTNVFISDNPAINMEIAFWPGYRTPQWLTTVFGAAYAMFFPSSPINPNTFVQPEGRTNKGKNILIEDIVDAVECVNDATKMQLKRMPTVLDAGAAYVAGTYCGQSISRRIKEVKPDGRCIYWDTNNTTEDFQINETPVIRRNGAKIPAWNTWAE